MTIKWVSTEYSEQCWCSEVGGNVLIVLHPVFVTFKTLLSVLSYTLNLGILCKISSE